MAGTSSLAETSSKLVVLHSRAKVSGCSAEGFSVFLFPKKKIFVDFLLVSSFFVLVSVVGFRVETDAILDYRNSQRTSRCALCHVLWMSLAFCFEPLCRLLAFRATSHLPSIKIDVVGAY